MPTKRAAARTDSLTRPSRPGGVQMKSSATPATWAGIAFINTVDAYDPSPPGT